VESLRRSYNTLAGGSSPRSAREAFMKKTKKLVLAKETLRSLETGDLQKMVAGIQTENTCNNQSICYTRNCPTWYC
jgi:hypothetical protein